MAEPVAVALEWENKNSVINNREAHEKNYNNHNKIPIRFSPKLIHHRTAFLNILRVVHTHTYNMIYNMVDADCRRHKFIPTRAYICTIFVKHIYMYIIICVHYIIAYK